MGIRPHGLCVALLAVLELSGAPAIAGVLALSPGSASVLPINLDGLAAAACGEVAKRGTEVPIVRCTVRVRNLFSENQIGVPVGPLSTPCGTQDATLAITAIHLPVSPADLQEIPEDARQGPFAGVLAMSTLLHLTNHETGLSTDLPFHLGTGLPDPVLDGESGKAGSLISIEKRGQELEMTFKSCVPEWPRQVFPELEIVEAYCTFCPDPANECDDLDQGDGCRASTRAGH